VPKPRPNFYKSLKALIEDVASQLSDFRHIRSSRILVVAGEARRASRGTVKPLAFQGAKSGDVLGRRKPIVRFRGKRMLYCITLRPLFFRASTPQKRIATLMHELYHIAPAFDGTLDPGRRHARAGKSFSQKLRPLVQRYLKQCPPEVRAAFAYDGEVLVHQWLERPVSWYEPGKEKVRTSFTDEHLFLAPVRMVTPRTRAAKGPKARIKLH
jgi:hypothetical protein